jgi:hypothetical protein
MERAFGDVHDGGARNHRRQRLPGLVADVEDHVHLNGPWQYKLSDLYDEPAVTLFSRAPARRTCDRIA